MHIVVFEVYLSENNMSLLDLDNKIGQEPSEKDLKDLGFDKFLWGSTWIHNKNIDPEDYAVYEIMITYISAVYETEIPVGSLLYYPKRFKGLHNINEWNSSGWLAGSADLCGKAVIDIDDDLQKIIIPIKDICDIVTVMNDIYRCLPQDYIKVKNLLNIKFKTLPFTEEKL